MRVLLFVLCCKITLSQVIFNESISGNMALAGATVTDTTFVCLYTNQAAMVHHKNYSVGVGYSNRFSFQELSVKTLGVVLPMSKSDFISTTINSYGYSDYNQNKFSLAYAKLIGQNFSASVQFNYHLINLIRRHSLSSFSVDLGFLTKITNKLKIGLYIVNPSLAEIKNDEIKEKLPYAIRLGARYHINKKVHFMVEVEKYNVENMLLKIGIDYAINDMFSFKIGTSNGIYMLSSGVDIVFKKIIFGFATAYHKDLKYISSISLVYH